MGSTAAANGILENATITVVTKTITQLKHLSYLWR